VDFNFSAEQRDFAAEVEAFLDEHDDPEVFDLTRENMAQIVDTPKRRAFMRQLGQKGWLGLTWPKEYGGSEGEGVYEYLLNEALAGRGGPQIGKGVGIIGKTLIAHGNDFLKKTFLPMILNNDVEFAVGYSEPNAGSDAASMRLKAERTEQDGKPGWLLNGQKTWTTSAHFAEWYWLGTRTDPEPSWWRGTGSRCSFARMAARISQRTLVSGPPPISGWRRSRNSSLQPAS
jgi:alkylation response protein AidB-like acyl-CoA dehydrogenase